MDGRHRHGGCRRITLWVALAETEDISFQSLIERIEVIESEVSPVGKEGPYTAAVTLRCPCPDTVGYRLLETLAVNDLGCIESSSQYLIVPGVSFRVQSYAFQHAYFSPLQFLSAGPRRLPDSFRFDVIPVHGSGKLRYFTTRLFAVNDSTMSSTLNSTPLVSSETCEYIDHLRTKYGIMGAAIGVVADTESGWVTELKAFGVADAKGNEVTTEASSSHSSSLFIAKDVGNSLYSLSLPTRKCSRRCALRCSSNERRPCPMGRCSISRQKSRIYCLNGNSKMIMRRRGSMLWIC